ncbi:MAG: dinitrogenase iron-molybdenum cofactor biosynthesis protein [Desulfobacteraceae bacterium]|nr:dinitrogenase iron-molybdenum cofactor biosynthesis protein [Desulfobacteraceae bacterium]
MKPKILIPLYGSQVAPRFDLSTEVIVVNLGETLPGKREKILVLPHASPDELCRLILTEKVDVVICGGIEEEYFQYLSWKRVQVIDSVIGSSKSAIQHYRNGKLLAGAILPANTID